MRSSMENGCDLGRRQKVAETAKTNELIRHYMTTLILIEERDLVEMCSMGAIDASLFGPVVNRIFSTPSHLRAHFRAT